MHTSAGFDSTRTRAEEALRLRDAELAEAQRLARLGSWQWYPETDTVTWSEELYRIAGLDPNLPAVSYREHPKLFTAESWERLRGAVEEALRTGTPYELDVEMVRADGTKLWVIARGEAQRDSTGRIVQLRGTVQDIAERKQAEEARLRHAAIVEFSDDAIVSKDLDGVILTWNRGAQRLFGFTEAEAVGRPITIIIPEELHAEENEVLRRVKNGEHIEHLETIRLTKEGKRLDVSLTISPLRDWTGKTVGSCKIARDITLSKLAEASLRESEERFRLVANTAPVMIWMSGPNGLCTYFNQPWLEFTGRTIHDELGNGWSEGVHPDDLERCLETYTKAINQRESFQMEYRLRRHDGEYRWILDSGVPRWNSVGSFTGFIGSCVDVAERKQAELALSDMSRRLIEAHEEERTWIARELHDDINQRLALLAVNLQLLKRTLPASATTASQGLAEMSQEVSYIGNDIQALSHRLHSSKLEYLGIAVAASSFCKELSERQGVAIDFHSEGIPKDLPQEIAVCLFRVLQEAAQNAVKHSGSQHLEMSLVGGLNAIQLIVRDSGIGFDPKAAVNGHGLGLVSMKERLRLVDGELAIESRLHVGTTIHAHVPLNPKMKSAGA
ncbi:MAG TPA: PAS domain S-box protein [Candidatus Acidoferrum sp.]